ncbi:hypothetical protein GC207_08620 [bacterium]|nr:hypothetical protein [bacterium]
MVIAQLRPLSWKDFGYNRKSVEWLEDYIERLRAGGEFEDENNRHKLESVFGSYLGECLVQCYGGSWIQREGTWCVAFDDQNVAFPFSKIAKQIDNGLDDGIAGFFRVVPEVFGELVSLSVPSKRPWWKFWAK